MLSRETWIFEDARVTSERRSIALRREWNDRHFMNREPSLIDLSPSGAAVVRAPSTAPQGPQHGPARPARRFRPRRKWRSDRTWRRGALAGSAQLTYRDVSASGGCARPPQPRHRIALPSPHAPIPISTKVRAITNLRINYSRCYLKIFVCDAKHSGPAAGADTESHTRTASPPRGDWWGQAAPAPAEAPTHAHTAGRPFPRVQLAAGASGTTAPHYHSADSWTPIDRRVGTNIRPSLYAHECVLRSQRGTTHAQEPRELLAAAPRAPAPRVPRRCATFDNFSRKITCSVAVVEARPPATATWPHHEHEDLTIATHSTPTHYFYSSLCFYH